MRRMFSLVLALIVCLAMIPVSAPAEETSGVEDGVLTVAMECAYAPYNWTQPDDSTARCRSATPTSMPTATT